MTKEQHKATLQSASWRRRRQAVISEAGSRCEECEELFARHQLDVHHDPPVDETTTKEQFYQRWRLHVLCHSCHTKETIRTTKFGQGWQPWYKRKVDPVPVLDDGGKLTEEWKGKMTRQRKPHSEWERNWQPAVPDRDLNLNEIAVLRYVRDHAGCSAAALEASFEAADPRRRPALQQAVSALRIRHYFDEDADGCELSPSGYKLIFEAEKTIGDLPVPVLE